MPVAPRPALQSLDLPAHGGLDYAELARLGIQPDEILDFSANLNPWGMPPAAAQAAAGAVVSRYPDGDSTALRQALAARLGIGPEQIIAGNGSSELLWLIALAYVDAGDRVLIAGPTFGEYERAARLAGAEVIQCLATAESGFRPDPRSLCHVAERLRPKVIFLCNPNNPTGAYLDRAAVQDLSACASDSLLVLDEAYVGFVDRPWPSLDLAGDGVLVLRSLTKDYGLAGLRLGYAVAGRDVVEALAKAKPPWNVNGAAQAAGIGALSDTRHVDEARERLSEAADYLVEALRALGLRPLPSATSFFVVEVGDGARFRARLLERGLLVRDCASFGMPRHARIAARSLPDCRRLVEAVADIISNGGVAP